MQRASFHPSAPAHAIQAGAIVLDSASRDTQPCASVTGISPQAKCRPAPTPGSRCRAAGAHNAQQPGESSRSCRDRRHVDRAFSRRNSARWILPCISAHRLFHYARTRNPITRSLRDDNQRQMQRCEPALGGSVRSTERPLRLRQLRSTPSSRHGKRADAFLHRAPPDATRRELHPFLGATRHARTKRRRRRPIIRPYSHSTLRSPRHAFRAARIRPRIGLAVSSLPFDPPDTSSVAKLESVDLHHSSVSKRLRVEPVRCSRVPYLWW